jgi:RHS repeat-associated protein
MNTEAVICIAGHGSVRFLTIANATVTDTYTYDAFGILLSPSTPPANNNYLYSGQQYDRDLGLYFNRARYFSSGTGRFWTLDNSEGTRGDPLTLHKYLYCQNNAVTGIDPGGNEGDFISTLGAGILSAGLSAMSAASTIVASGYGEISLFIAAVGYQEAYEQGGWGGIAVQAGISLVPVGQLMRVFRGFPAWMKPNEINTLAKRLLSETRQSVPSAGLNAAASGLRFSQQIKAGSVIVKGAGVLGADVEAIAIVNGVEKKIARELVAFQGDLSKNAGKALYDALDSKATRQAINAHIREIQLELTEQAMSSVQNWREIVKQKLLNFSKIHPDVTVHLVDSAGNDISL